MSTIYSNVLFLCTGNYYRSRFAEHLFNHLATYHKLRWRAFSRGLATYHVPKSAGPISPYALQGLALRGITDVEVREPISLSETDLDNAHHIVALKYVEHHPLISQNFPAWINQVEYWHVHDIDQATPEEALPQIEMAVLGLVNRLAERLP